MAFVARGLGKRGNRMGRLQEEFDRVLDKHFSVEAVAYRLITQELEHRGIELTRAAREDISRSLDKLREGGSIPLDISAEELQKARLTPEERAKNRIVLRPDLDRHLEEIPEIVRDIMPNLVEEVAEKMLTSIKGNARRQLAKLQKKGRRFENRLRRRWGKALDMLDVLRAVSSEAGDDANYELSGDPEFETDPVLFVLARLHARACQIASEVATLLRSGHADGAHARWRTLHEIAVIGRFVRQHGADVAERYILHDAIESWKAARMYEDNAEKLGVEPLTERELRTLEDRAHELTDRFGRHYASDYGWAADAIDKRQPNFSEIERSVGQDHMRPYYKLASHNVHADPKGAFQRLGLIDEGSLLLAGPSDAGLVTPAHSTAISLCLSTISLLTLAPNLDRLVVCNILLHLQDEVGKEFAMAHDAMILN